MSDPDSFSIGDIVSRCGDGDLWEVIKGCVGFDTVYARCIQSSPPDSDGHSWCNVGDEEIFLSDRLDLEQKAQL